MISARSLREASCVLLCALGGLRREKVPLADIRPLPESLSSFESLRTASRSTRPTAAKMTLLKAMAEVGKVVNRAANAAVAERAAMARKPKDWVEICFSLLERPSERLSSERRRADSDKRLPTTTRTGNKPYDT
jgi:hypothetical protein